MDEERVATKVSPEWFLLLAITWPTMALTVVPFGRVTSVVGGITLLEAATGLAVAAGFAAATLVESDFLAAGLAAAVLAAAGFAGAFLGGTCGAGAWFWFAASSVALLEQPASVRNAAAATARKRLRGP